MAIGVEKIGLVKPIDENIRNRMGTKYPRKIGVQGDKKILFDAEYFKNTPDERKGRARWVAIPEIGLPYTADNQIGVIGDRVEISIPLKFCGAQQMLVEGFMSQPENKYPTKILVHGIATPKVTSATWSKHKGGSSLGSTPIKYGEHVWLRLETEGLNGSYVHVEIFHDQKGSDEYAKKTYSVKCLNGEVNLHIRSTFSWKSVRGWWDDSEEEYYAKIKLAGKDEYLLERTDLLVFSEENSVKEVFQSEQARPLKLGETEINLERYESCRFNKISISEDGKPVDLFEEGKLKLRGEAKSEFGVSECIYFVVDEHDLTPEAKAVLDRMSVFLLDNPFVPVVLGAHCDIRSDDNYNDKLSLRRAKSSVDYLIGKNVAKDRITARGYGKRKLINKGQNISEKLHRENRRLTIEFKIFGSDAESIVYETIATGDGATKPKYIDFSVTGLESTDHCFQKGTDIEHDTIIEVVKNTNKEQTRLRKDGLAPINLQVISRSPTFTVAPLDFIFPHMAPVNEYWFKVNTCRYYSDKNKNTVVVKAYPDIKWDFHFFINLSKPLDASWQGLDSSGVARMRKLSGQIAAQKRWKQTEVAMGVALNAHWDKKSATEYDHDFDVSAKWEDKFKWAHKVFGGLQSLSKGITKSTKGKASKIVGKKSKLEVTLLQPNISFGAEWELARGEENGVSLPQLGTQVKIYLAAKPFVGLEVKIDLIDGLLKAASVATTGNTAAAEIVGVVRAWAEKGYESENVKINFEMWIDAIITGKIDAEGSWKWNTEGDKVEGKAEITGKIGVELKAGVKLNAKMVLLKTGKKADTVSNQEGVKLDAVATASVSSGEIAIRVGANVNYKTEEGLYMEPIVFLEPCIAKALFLIEVKLSYKVVSADWTPVNISGNRTFWDKINILENLVGHQPRLQILKP